MKLLSVDNLSIKYKKSLYLNNINFSLAKGETKIIIGESGGGKSLLAKTIINYLPPGFSVNKGKILFNGRNIFSFDKEALRKIRGGKIYYITQDPYIAFDPTYKIGKQLKEFLKEKKTEYNEKIVFKTLEELGFKNPEKIIKQYPFQLSGGMLQRVSILRGVLSKPDLIIADEPTSGLDYELQLELIRLLKKIIFDKELSLIFITHNMKIVEEFKGKTTLVLYKGEIIEKNGNILKIPLHPYTRILIKAIPSVWKKGEKLKTVNISTDKISLSEYKGCKFYNRCLYKSEKCKSTPPLINKGGNFVKCFLYSE